MQQILKFLINYASISFVYVDATAGWRSVDTSNVNKMFKIHLYQQQVEQLQLVEIIKYIHLQVLELLQLQTQVLDHQQLII
jgi:hypothetical protein